ncbi:ABC transporter ATP-binding protein [Candidatus Poriferisodalis sp.]|uniref:ABC transporter ATP-binding protein n=1 Tax=Candidatus Poriferisodalis sp. TaxID=3101277 RepID=UPI003B015215
MSHTGHEERDMNSAEPQPEDNGTPDGAPAAVDVAGVSKVFNPGRSNEIKALTGIDLRIDPGEFVTLIGPSGCGKSTLLRLIAALTGVTEGSVAVNGKTADQARLDRDYSMVFQRAGLFDWRNVSRNIELPLELMGWKAAERRERSAEMLDLVKLSEFARHHPAELSGGMQQRVAIARAMSFHPQLLLMDEPFGALDEMTREHMQNELLRIWAETQITVIFVTHSISEAVFLSTRVVVMSPRPGRISAVIDVDLGERNEATRDDPAYFSCVTAVRDALREGDES